MNGHTCVASCVCTGCAAKLTTPPFAKGFACEVHWPALVAVRARSKVQSFPAHFSGPLNGSDGGVTAKEPVLLAQKRILSLQGIESTARKWSRIWRHSNRFVTLPTRKATTFRCQARHRRTANEVSTETCESHSIARIACTFPPENFA